MSYKKSSIQILKLKNQTYLPFQLHQLPKYFDKSTIDYFNHKGYCYINLKDIKTHNKFFNLQNFIDRLTFNQDIHYTQKR
jgi:hypothetical protein